MDTLSPLLGLLKPLRVLPQTPHALAEPELSGTEDIYPVSTEDATAAGLQLAAVMSSVETGQMSAAGDK